MFPIITDTTTNTKIIIDDISSWAPFFDLAIRYIQCQQQVCLAQNLLLSLNKSYFLPARIEFVGHDVCDDGNMPAQSKKNLLETWLNFKTVCDVSSFVGFVLFYVPYIPQAEVYMSKLRELMDLPYENRVDTIITQKHLRSGMI